MILCHLVSISSIIHIWPSGRLSSAVSPVLPYIIRPMLKAFCSHSWCPIELQVVTNVVLGHLGIEFFLHVMYASPKLSSRAVFL